MALTGSGVVYTWGANASGQLGDGTTTGKTSPVSVLSGVKAIAAGGGHTLAIKTDGTVWAWGSNVYSELGDGTTTSHSAPTQISGLSNAIAIAAGAYHSLAIVKTGTPAIFGTVKAWGTNTYSQLGDGTTTTRPTPITVPNLPSSSAVAAGSYHSLVVGDDGHIRAFGYNYDGELGDGTFNSRSTAVQVLNLAGISNVSAGPQHSMARATNGSVYTWGYNIHYELGNGSQAASNLATGTFSSSVADWVQLNPIHRVFLNNSDHLANIGPLAETVTLGEVFYLSQNPVGGSAIHRLWNQSTDHMISLTSNEGGYTDEGLIGHAWASQLTGMDQITRTVNAGDHDVRNMFLTEDGFADEPFTAFAYPRYGAMNESLLSLTDGNVTIKSNVIYGGVLWEWWWGGQQFLNHPISTCATDHNPNGVIGVCKNDGVTAVDPDGIPDAGRQIQSDFRAFDWGVGTPNNPPNPTEGGDGWGHGSPILSAYNNGSTQITSTSPLEFAHLDQGADSVGATPSTPVVWPGIKLGKAVTLNFQNRGPVAYYETQITLPRATSSGAIQMPSAYLRATFNRSYSYDPAITALTELTSHADLSGCDGQHLVTDIPIGGVILSTAGQDYAMGMYAGKTSSGGTVSYFDLYKGMCWTTEGTGENDYNTWGMLAYRDTNSGALPAGPSSYHVWIISGALSDVTQQMDWLYANGYK